MNSVKLNSSFLVLLGIGILSFLLLSVAISRVVYPFDTGNAEALNWIPARHLLDGKNPYSFAVTEPYSMAPYGILHYALLAVGIKFFGFQLWWGRTISILAFAVFLWATTRIARQVIGSKQAAAATCLASLAMFPAQMWIGLMRSDFTAAALATTALYLVFAIEKSDRVKFWRLAATTLLAFAAVLTKHTYLLPIGFIFLRLCQLDQWRAAFGFVAAFAGLFGAAMCLLNYTSANGYIWQHFVHAQRLPFSFDYLLDHFPANVKLPVFFIFLCFLLIFAVQQSGGFRNLTSARKWEILRSPKTLVYLYFAVSLASATISSGRVGANVNYFIENSFAASVICGIIYEHWQSRKSFELATAFVVLLALGGSFQLARVLRGERFRWQAVAYYREIFARTAEFVKPGDVCAGVAPEMVIWNDCQFNFDDYGEYSGGWAPELGEIFKREVETGRYAAIVWEDDNFHRKFPNYRLVPMSQDSPKNYYSLYLYVPTAPQSH